MAETDDAAGFRMEDLATLPVFFKLRGRRVVMAGGDAPAVWKAELISATGADVVIYAEAPCPSMEALASRIATVTLIGRRWTVADLSGAALAIGGIEDEEEADAFRIAAREAGVPVNVIDKPAFCDFQFGTVVARSPLVIAISTDGAAPVFGQALRARIEALLPQGLKAWAQAAKDWRPDIQSRGFDFRTRRRFWETFTERALDHADQPPTDDDRNACLAAAIESQSAAAGRVSFVGAGDGTPAMVTLGGIAALQSADLVLYDPDVSLASIGLARREAIKRPTPTEPADLRGTVVTEATKGRHVVVLGTGDPTTCARWQARATLVAEALTTNVPGIGQCPACHGQCRYPAR